MISNTMEATSRFEATRVKFIDFDPTKNLIERALEKFGHVFGESPSDSSANATVTKTSKGFEGRLKITSAVGTFVADVINEDPLKVIETLSQNIRTQLNNWKRSRESLLEVY